MSKVGRNIRITVNLAQNLTISQSLPSSPLEAPTHRNPCFGRSSLTSREKGFGIRIPGPKYNLPQKSRSTLSFNPKAETPTSASSKRQAVDEPTELSPSFDKLRDLQAQVEHLQGEVSRLRAENKLLRSRSTRLSLEKVKHFP